MIHSVKGRCYRPYDGSVEREVSLGFGQADKLRITRIDGLGPVQSTISDLENANDPGSYFLNAKDGNRNIVLAVELIPHPVEGLEPGGDPATASLMRSALQYVFTPGRKIELEIVADQVGTVIINGVVETNAPEIFTKNPTVQISIICHDPYFYRPGKPLITLTPNWLTGVNSNVGFVDNPGDYPASFTFTAQVTSNRAGGVKPLIAHANAPGGLKTGPITLMNTYPLVAGDWFTFDTRKGKRSARHERNLALVDDLGYFSGSLTDSKLLPGRNYFIFLEKDWCSNISIKTELPIGGV